MNLYTKKFSYFFYEESLRVLLYVTYCTCIPDQVRKNRLECATGFHDENDIDDR